MQILYNVKNKNKCPLPLCFVDILKQYNNKYIFDIKFLLNIKVWNEKPQRKDVVHHSIIAVNPTDIHETIVTTEPKCVKCGDNHPMNVCSKDRHSPVKCALCTKEYIANFKGCPVYKVVFKKQF